LFSVFKIIKFIIYKNIPTLEIIPKEILSSGIDTSNLVYGIWYMVCVILEERTHCEIGKVFVSYTKPPGFKTSSVT
jgi:hypothetical protein